MDRRIVHRESTRYSPGMTKYRRWFISFLCLASILIVSSCGSDNTSQANPTPTVAPVNGFGTPANHVHDMLALPDGVLILATHYGLFRSPDAGKSWTKVAAGQNQLMQGLMTYSLSYSPLNIQRLYVLTQIAVYPHKGTLGLYTSADEGKTWKLSTPTSSLTSGYIFMETAGNDNPDEIYVYLRDLGSLGLKVSMDDGQHFSTTGTLPFNSILGLLALPGEPGHLLAYGDEGMARSTDGGAHWQVVKGITGGISSMATGAPHTPIYASGDAGIQVSTDDGVTFTVVNANGFYKSLTVAKTQTSVVYGETGRAVYQTTDGGKTWKALPHIAGNLSTLAANPTNASQVYLSLSYPTAVYELAASGSSWQSLTPQV